MSYQPRIVDAWLTDPYVLGDGRVIPGAVRYHNRNWAGIQAIVIHVQEGWNNGTKQHFRSVKASSTVIISRTGLIERLVPEDKAPWTNGDVKNPDAQVRGLMAKYGNDPNTWTLTMECEGFTGGLPYSEDQYQSILWQVRDWRRRYGKIPVLAHRQINSVDRSYCPEGPNGKFLPRLYADLASDSPEPSPAPVPKPDLPRTFTLRFDTYVRRSPGFWDTEKNQANVIKLLKAGTTGEVISGPKTVDGVEFYDLKIDGFGTGWVQDQVLHTLDIKEGK